MTERLYYTDPYLHKFTAQVVDRSDGGATIYLDRTAFYPTSGGQPFDLGEIAGVAVTEIVDEDDRIAHRLAAPVETSAVECAVDWARRFDHMQQHTGQHLLSAVLEEMFGLKTVSFHLGAESATIDVEGRSVDTALAQKAETRANQVIFENRPVAVTFEDAAQVQGLRKPSDREGTLRIISIDGLDRSACGGTHVRATGEIGTILIRKLEKIRNQTRLEFLCGGRAVKRARADYEALSRAAQSFSAPLDAVPAMIGELIESSRTAEKSKRKLELELAGYKGREIYQATTPAADGVRRVFERAATGNLEDLRAVAQSFTAQPKSVYLATLNQPPSVLLAVSADTGINAGQAVKSALTEAGGRGGGATSLAQGSVPDLEKLENVIAALQAAAGFQK
jgi:alanyl-tRNA synthetase